MDWTTIFATIWAALNSPAGITAMATVALWGLNRIYAAKPLWEQYEGTIISAVKFAEQNIADDTENKGLARLDAALKYVVKVYEEAQGRKATSAEISDLTNGIQIVHDSLEAQGTL